MNDLRKLHYIVWDLREEIHATWPTPESGTCLRYAFTEAGEAMDAWLRVERPGDVRNHLVVVTSGRVRAELADCAMMLLSALGPEWGNDWRDSDCPLSLDQICGSVGTLLFDCVESESNQILHIVSAIARYANMDLEAELAIRLAKIRAKHVACTEAERDLRTVGDGRVGRRRSGSLRGHWAVSGT